MSIVSFIGAILALIIVLKLISLPFKIIIKFVINSIIGGVILTVLSFFGFGITITWWVVALTGLFGVPGVVVAILLSMFVL